VQGFMSEALLPFESEEEMFSEFSQEPHPKVISSYWEDEMNQDGNIYRKSERMVGTEDLTDWAQAVAAAMITPAEDESDSEPDMQGTVYSLPCFWDYTCLLARFVNNEVACCASRYCVQCSV
jgi:hypothetical protein